MILHVAPNDDIFYLGRGLTSQSCARQQDSKARRETKNVVRRLRCACLPIIMRFVFSLVHVAFDQMFAYAVLLLVRLVSDGMLGDCWGRESGIALPVAAPPIAPQECVHQVDCAFGEWDAWQPTICANPGDQRSRVRRVATAPANGGSQCSGVTNETMSCDRHVPPPVDCALGEWGNWTACSKDCLGALCGKCWVLVAEGSQALDEHRSMRGGARGRLAREGGAGCG